MTISQTIPGQPYRTWELLRHREALKSAIIISLEFTHDVTASGSNRFPINDMCSANSSGISRIRRPFFTVAMIILGNAAAFHEMAAPYGMAKTVMGFRHTRKGNPGASIDQEETTVWMAINKGGGFISRSA